MGMPNTYGTDANGNCKVCGGRTSTSERPTGGIKIYCEDTGLWTWECNGCRHVFHMPTEPWSGVGQTCYCPRCGAIA